MKTCISGFLASVFLLLVNFANAHAREILVLPLQVQALATAHHRELVSYSVLDEHSRPSSPFDLRTENGPALTQFYAAYCTKPGSKGTYSLLVGADRETHPLRSRRSKIPNLARIGHPSLEAGPMVPHDFVMMELPRFGGQDRFWGVIDGAGAAGDGRRAKHLAERC